MLEGGGVLLGRPGSNGGVDWRCGRCIGGRHAIADIQLPAGMSQDDQFPGGGMFGVGSGCRRQSDSCSQPKCVAAHHTLAPNSSTHPGQAASLSLIGSQLESTFAAAHPLQVLDDSSESLASSRPHSPSLTACGGMGLGVADKYLARQQGCHGAEGEVQRTRWRRSLSLLQRQRPTSAQSARSERRSLDLRVSAAPQNAARPTPHQQCCLAACWLLAAGRQSASAPAQRCIACAASLAALLTIVCAMTYDSAQPFNTPPAGRGSALQRLGVAQTSEPDLGAAARMPHAQSASPLAMHRSVTNVQEGSPPHSRRPASANAGWAALQAGALGSSSSPFGGSASGLVSPSGGSATSSACGAGSGSGDGGLRGSARRAVMRSSSMHDRMKGLVVRAQARTKWRRGSMDLIAPRCGLLLGSEGVPGIDGPRCCRFCLCSLHDAGCTPRAGGSAACRHHLQLAQCPACLMLCTLSASHASCMPHTCPTHCASRGPGDVVGELHMHGPGAPSAVTIQAKTKVTALLVRSSCMSAAQLDALPSVRAELARSQTESNVAQCLDLFASYSSEMSSAEELRTLAAAGLLDGGGGSGNHSVFVNVEAAGGASPRAISSKLLHTLSIGSSFGGGASRSNQSSMKSLEARSTSLGGAAGCSGGGARSNQSSRKSLAARSTNLAVRSVGLTAQPYSLREAAGG